jgi:hypothetical protein
MHIRDKSISLITIKNISKGRMFDLLILPENSGNIFLMLTGKIIYNFYLIL